MTSVRSDTTECPYCTSPVTLTSHHDGHLEVWHHKPFRPGCEAGLRKLMAESASQQDMQLVIRNDPAN
jgi:hypothetical protein